MQGQFKPSISQIQLQSTFLFSLYLRTNPLRMKYFLLALGLFLTSHIYGQSSLMKTYIADYKAHSEGYTLIEEGGTHIQKTQRVNFDYVQYKPGYEYLVVGFIDDCKPCNVELHFLKDNNSTRKEISLQYQDEMAIVAQIFHFNSNQKGEFGFMHNHNSSKYMHIMLFSKPK